MPKRYNKTLDFVKESGLVDGVCAFEDYTTPYIIVPFRPSDDGCLLEIEIKILKGETYSHVKYGKHEGLIREEDLEKVYWVPLRWYYSVDYYASLGEAFETKEEAQNFIDSLPPAEDEEE